jgi:hypothetical protein
MKRYLHPLDNANITLWEKICSMENLQLAHQNAKDGKGWYKEVKMIDADLDHYLKQLQTMLLLKTYHTSDYENFFKKEGNKIRLLSKLPYFPDRICHWAIIQVIEPILIKKMIANTYSAIPDRGIHRCLHDVQAAMQNDVKGCQYCLMLDVRKYYQSINHDILKQTYRRIFKDKDLIWLLDEIIDSTPGDTGVPIGNYISQYSGNIYLTEFDHWIKEVKKVKHYYRYMDDVRIFAETKEELHRLFLEIKEFYATKLKLTIKDNWQIFPTYKRGIDFVGYRSFLEYTLLRKSTCISFKNKMVKINRKRLEGKPLNHSEWCSINSYYGWLKHCDSFRLCQKYLEPLKQYANAYYITNIKRKG